MLWTILLIILILALVGGIPAWGPGGAPYGWYGAGWYGGGGLGLIVVILLILLLLGRI